MLKKLSIGAWLALAALFASVAAAAYMVVGPAGGIWSTVAPYSPYVQEITFKDLISTVGQSKLPVFIEEYDPNNCDASCQMQHDIVNDLAQTYQGKINFYRVSNNSSEFRTGTVSPVYFMVDPPFSVYDTESGVKTEAQLTKFIDDAYAEIVPPVPPTPAPAPPTTPPAAPTKP